MDMRPCSYVCKRIYELDDHNIFVNVMQFDLHDIKKDHMLHEHHNPHRLNDFHSSLYHYHRFSALTHEVLRSDFRSYARCISKTFFRYIIVNLRCLLVGSSRLTYSGYSSTSFFLSSFLF